MFRNCNNKKHRIRQHYVLSNGQILTIEFKRTIGRDGSKWSKIFWYVAININNTVRKGNDYFNKRKYYKKLEKHITGKCGVEGLKKALDVIIDFCNYLKDDEVLTLNAADDRRFRVYKRLLKYNFFLDEKKKIFTGYNQNVYQDINHTKNFLERMMGESYTMVV